MAADSSLPEPARTDPSPDLSSPAMNALEEGLEPDIDWGKLAKVGQTGRDVLPVVLQNADTGEVLFVGYANAIALAKTFELQQAVLWSTSRNELWHKGATSGDVLDLVDVRINCEQNSLLYRVRPQSGACHTQDSDGKSRAGCYYRRVLPGNTLEFA